MGSPARKPLEQINPGRAQQRLAPSLILTGIKPLAFTAARKSERILAKRLVVMPTATGLTAASRALIAAISSAMAAGSSPSRIATRFTAETRSRRRVAESLPCALQGGQHARQGTGSAGRGVGAFVLAFLGHAILLSGASGLVPSGLGRTGGDRGGNSGIL